MTIDDIAEELSQSELVEAGDVAALFALAIERYTNDRLDAVDIEQDGDMLLFQWGTYGKGPEKRFTVDLTRQVTLDLSDPDDAADSMRQLHVAAVYLCSPETEQLGSGEKWCATPRDTQEFASSVKGSPAYLWAASNSPASLEVNLEGV
jgi:hypothetical protein